MDTNKEGPEHRAGSANPEKLRRDAKPDGIWRGGRSHNICGFGLETMGMRGLGGRRRACTGPVVSFPCDFQMVVPSRVASGPSVI